MFQVAFVGQQQCRVVRWHFHLAELLQIVFRHQQAVLVTDRVHDHEYVGPAQVIVQAPGRRLQRQQEISRAGAAAAAAVVWRRLALALIYTDLTLYLLYAPSGHYNKSVSSINFILLIVVAGSLLPYPSHHHPDSALHSLSAPNLL